MNKRSQSYFIVCPSVTPFQRAASWQSHRVLGILFVNGERGREKKREAKKKNKSDGTTMRP